VSAEPDGMTPPPPGAHPGRFRRFRRFPRWQMAAAGAAVACAVTAAVLATGSDGGTVARSTPTARPPGDGLRHTAVDASTGGCGRGWSRATPGTQVFDLRNTGGSATEVYLTDPRSGKVYGELEGLAPGVSRPMLVDLGSGSYAFKCLQEDTDAVTGPTVVVPGRTPRGPAAVPVTEHDLIPPTLAYQKWVGGRIAELARGVGTLRSDIDRGDLAAARRDWLTAHLVYERMGAAYGTFGAADGAINGTAARTPGAVRDPGFTGFHRIEYGLWHGAPAASLRGPAARLAADVAALREGWPQERMDPADLGLRAHEIVENTEQFELTGRTDYGSGTSLATARANLDGTAELLDRLDALLAPRDPGGARLKAALKRAEAGLDAAHHGGRWTPLGGLTHDQRQRLNADFGDLLEQLAPVAAILDVRRTA
jgi:iron uptake system component EfeO